VGPAAALATLKKLKERNVSDHVARIGGLMMDVWRAAGQKHGLPLSVPEGYPCLAHFGFDHALANELKTLCTTLMLKRGFLAGPAIYPTLAHTEDIVAQYADALDGVFAELAEALDKNDVTGRLEGPPAHQGFRRLL
jgi:glutamate-1-semialdehyde aminotransferase